MQMYEERTIRQRRTAFFFREEHHIFDKSKGIAMIRLNVFIDVKPENRAAVLEAARELVACSLKDEGCVAYDVFESATRSNVLMICETWRDAGSARCPPEVRPLHHAGAAHRVAGSHEVGAVRVLNPNRSSGRLCVCLMAFLRLSKPFRPAADILSAALSKA